MKKLLCVLLALAACCLLVTAVAAADAVPTTCQACNSTKTWEVMPSAIPETAGHYHYYLSADVTPGQLLVKDGVTLCLDLNGHSIKTNGRAMIVYTGSVANIMDSSVGQTGLIQGSRGDNNATGGTITVQDSATLRLYSGTLHFQLDDSGKQLTNRAGAVWVKSGAAMYMYGGRVKGGELMQNGTATSYGGAISVASTGTLHISGGEITSGILPEGGLGPCVYMESNTAKITLSGDAKVEEIYMPAGCLSVSGTYSGKARLYLKGTPSAGLAVGTADNATVSGDLFCTNGDGWLVNVSGSELKLAAYTPSGERHYCQHCKEVVKWTALTTSNYTQLKNTAGVYHFYLATDYTGSQLNIKNASTACLDLYGRKLTGNGRALYLDVNTGMNIMDTVGGGEVIGTTGTNNPTGGVMVIKAGAVCNFYSGTLRLEEKYVAGYGVGVGGIVYMNEAGTMNMYGGTIQGADLVMSEYSMSLHGLGAAFYMNSTAQLNVYGGEIKSGTLAEGCVGECVYLKSSTAKVNLYGSGTVGDVYCTSENDQITVSGSYTGSVNLTYPATVTLEENQVVGKAADATVTDGALTCGDEWLLQVSGSDLVLTPNAPAIVYAADGSTAKYEKLQDAIDNAGSGIVKLMKPITEDVTVAKDVYLDVNGKNITGTVTVSQGATLYGKDSQTDDYTVADGVYGQLTVSGNTAAMDGYLKVEEAGVTSFHKVTLDITHMTLRAAEAGVYYKCDFLGDEKVAQRISSFGVALSVYETPEEDNLETACRYSAFTDFESGAAGNTAASTLLKGVMKTTNTQSANQRNAQLPVYGRAYARLSDGTILFGEPVQRSFREQAEEADKLWGTLDVVQKTAVLSLYEVYGEIMQNWQIPNIIAQKDPSSDGITKILGIGNSYTIDSMHLLNAVYQAEKPGTKLQLGIAYYSGCTLASHVKFYNEDSAVYTYYYLDSETGKWVTTKEMTLKQIINAQNWDLVSMQQGSGTSGVASSYNSDIRTIQNFVDANLGYTPTFFWNMTWAYPEMDIPTDSYTLDNAPNANNFKKYYGSSQQTMYNMIMATVQEKIVPDTTFKWIMPVGTAVQNAQSSYMTDLDLYRDYTHLSDFARLMAAYTWYCQLEGTTLDSVQLTKVPSALKKSYTGSGDMVLTESQLDVLVESVKNAANTKFQVTQSQYTTE